MNDSVRQKWDTRYAEADPVVAQPCFGLRQFAYLLPTQGDALDLACGLGGNALFLARRGLRTVAWDISRVAIDKLSALAQREELPLKAEVRDVIAAPPPSASFSLIVVSHFLERGLAPTLMEALRPGGLLVYQTFTGSRSGATGGPSNPTFWLQRNELLRLFQGLLLLVYHEEGEQTGSALSSEALLIAQRGR